MHLLLLLTHIYHWWWQLPAGSGKSVGGVKRISRTQQLTAAVGSKRGRPSGFSDHNASWLKPSKKKQQQQQEEEEEEEEDSEAEISEEADAGSSEQQLSDSELGSSEECTEESEGAVYLGAISRGTVTFLLLLLVLGAVSWCNGHLLMCCHIVRWGWSPICCGHTMCVC